MSANKHPYHLVDPSPWPAMGAGSALLLFGGAVMFMHEISGGTWIMAVVMPDPNRSPKTEPSAGTPAGKKSHVPNTVSKRHNKRRNKPACNPPDTWPDLCPPTH